jgi:hypothetical protein
VESAGEVLLELSDIPRSRFRFLDYGDLFEDLISSDQTAILLLPPISIYERNDWDWIDNTDIKIEGGEPLISALRENRDLISRRQLHLLPEVLVSNRDSAYEDGGGPRGKWKRNLKEELLGIAS